MTGDNHNEDASPAVRIALAFTAVAVVAALGLGVGLAEWGGSTNTAVGSEHSTGTDFSGASLTNSEVSGDSVVFMDEELSSAFTSDPDLRSTTVASGAGTVIQPTTDVHRIDVTVHPPEEGGTVETISISEWNQSADEPGQELHSISTGGSLSASFTNIQLKEGEQYLVMGECEGSNCYWSGLASPSYSDYFTTEGGWDTDGTNWLGGRAMGEIDAFTTPDSGSYQHTHDITNATEATVDFSTSGATGQVIVEAQVDGSWTEVASTSLQDGAQTIALQQVDADQYRTRVETTRTDFHGTATLSSESLSFENTAPVISNMSPANGSQVSGSITLEADVEDPDLGSAQGDEVTATFYDASDDSVIGQDTISGGSTKQTVSTDWENPDAGDNSWYVVAEDSYGGTATSDTYGLTTPAELEVRNETGSNGLVDDVEVSIEFYFNRDDQPDLIENRTTTDGTVDMSGLPVDEPFIVVASADGYHNRRIYVPSLFDTQTVYLLDENIEAVQPTFTLTDFTGDYPVDTTVVEVQRNFNDEWRTVEGDFFGASNEMSTQLKFNERHRIRITNIATGQSRDLGTYTPTSSTMQELEVHADEGVILQDDEPFVSFSPTVFSLPARDGATVSVSFDPRDKEFQDYGFEVIHDGQVIGTFSGTQPGGETGEATLDLDGREGEVTVRSYWTLEDGTQRESTRVYDIRERLSNDHSLLAILLGLDTGGSEPPNAMTALITVFAAVLATGYTAARMGSGPAGLVGLSVVVMGALISFVPFTWAIAGAITWVALSALQSRI